MATVVSLTYADGHDEEVVLKSVDFVKAERKFKGVLPALEGALYAAWLRLSPGPPFDVWLDSLDDHRVRNDDVDPSQEDPSPGP